METLAQGCCGVLACCMCERVSVAEHDSRKMKELLSHETSTERQRGGKHSSPEQFPQLAC